MVPRRVAKFLLAGAVVLAAAGRSEAVPVIRFDNFLDTGLLQYNTVGGTLTGRNIGFDFLNVTDTLNAGTYACVGCRLNFETGVNTTNGPTNYEWAPGGTFTIRGEVDTVTPDGVEVVLLTGTFTHASAVGVNLPGGGADLILFSGSGIDTKHPDILTFFGLPVGVEFMFGSTDISNRATIRPNGTFRARLDEADVTNTASAVPEPGSAMLLLLGIGTLAAYRCRRR